MRLLVTNTHSKQAYSIVRSLRPMAERIVATVSGQRPFGFWPADHAAYSRLVDARYRVPDPETDWLGGWIQPTNTAREAAFIARILDICAQEHVDTIFPSSDAWVYVFSKNKALFEKRGILMPVPDLDTVLMPLDKYRTISAGREVGFPCPRTYLAESDEAVRRIARELPPPWTIKLRFTTGGRGMEFIEHRDALIERARAARERHGVPIIQEYIPGRDRGSVYLMLGRDKRVLSALMTRPRRRTRAMTGPASAVETIPLDAVAEHAIALARHVDWWGGLTVQYKPDPRDGQPKLMEINPRLGTHLWYRTELGINEPARCLQIARGETPEPVTDYPVGCLLLSPFEDLMLFPLDLLGLAVYRFRTEVLKRHVMDPSASRLSMENRFGCYWNDYFGPRERRLDPYFRYAAEDPLPLIVWLSKIAASSLDRLGRRIVNRLRPGTESSAVEAPRT